jgi:hypothetical protein
MIRYSLVCKTGHRFDSWFSNSAASEAQVAGGLVECPECGSIRIEKAIMAPSIGCAGRQAEPEPAPAPQPEPQPVALLSGREKELRRLLKEVREHVKKNADYVGDEFPELARQMHHEEIKKRSIYGEAQPDEVKELLEEGVEVQPLPMLPDERN